MPELPDVAVFKSYLDATSLHQTIASVDVRDDYVLKEISAGAFRSALRGRRFESSRRHGKYLFVELGDDDDDDAGWLLLHFGMTGYLEYFKDEADAPPHTRILFHFENAYHLAYDCRRKLGRVRLVRDPEAFLVDRDIGPDAMSNAFDFAAFESAMSGRRGTVKSALMNQKAMAGVGNAYSDETLFQARIHPRTRVSQLDEDVLRRLYSTLRSTLETAIECRVDPGRFPDDFINPERRPDGRCPRCGTAVERIVISGRGAYLCPECQPEP